MNCVIFFNLKNYFIISGASVVEAGTSESYKNNKAKLYWHGIGFLNYEMPPDIILQVKIRLKIACLYFRLLFLLLITKALVSEGEAALNLSENLKPSPCVFTGIKVHYFSFLGRKLWLANWLLLKIRELDYVLLK